jgi:DNA polymerase III sliding clamp (beta) subunit (PCNA family)
MKMPDAKIELAADSTPSRYTLNAIKLDVQGKRLMGTNGHILAIVPCEVTADDHSVLMSLESVKQIRAMQKRAKSIPVEIRTNSKVHVSGPGESAEFEVTTGQFPNVDMSIPKGEAYEGAATITLNVDLLMRLAKAIGSENHQGQHIVSLYIKDQQSSVLVKTSQDADAIGVIMPCRS